MPGFATHYLFGVDSYQELPTSKLKRIIQRNHSAYALGLQGPDVFFYYLPTYAVHKENIGALAHSSKTGTFFLHLMESRRLFAAKPYEQAIADAYIIGFLGHYTLDCAIHPYVYAFTGYDAFTPPSNLEYFGQHAYFETEIDNLLIYEKKNLLPSEFHQNATIRLNPVQKHVIAKLLVYAYRNTYPDILANQFLFEGAPFWMKLGTYALNDPSGQKKVLVRLFERILFGRAFISPMLPSDQHRFIADPLNSRRREWIHPWTGEHSTHTFEELYSNAKKHYLQRIHAYHHLMIHDFPEDFVHEFMVEHGGRSFLSGLPLSDES